MRTLTVSILTALVASACAATTSSEVPVTAAPAIVTSTTEAPVASTTTTTQIATTTTSTEQPMTAPFTLVPFDGNPVIPAPGPKGSSFLPAVVVESDTFHMWLTSSPDLLAVPTAIYHATSDDGISWTIDDTPAVAADGEGFDAFSTADARVVALDGGMWVMFYNARSEPGPGPGPAIGRATAPGPGGPWTTEAEPVVVTGQVWEAGFVSPASVIINDDGVSLFYSAGSNYAAFEPTLTGLATAPSVFDSFTKHGSPVLEPKGSGWDGHFRWELAAFPYDGGLAGFYSGDPTTLTGEAIGYAESTDGVTWITAAQPLLNPRDQAWASLDVVSSAVVEAPDGRLLLYYSGGNDLFSLSIGVAEIVQAG